MKETSQWLAVIKIYSTLPVPTQITVAVAAATVIALWIIFNKNVTK